MIGIDRIQNFQDYHDLPQSFFQFPHIARHLPEHFNPSEIMQSTKIFGSYDRTGILMPSIVLYCFFATACSNAANKPSSNKVWVDTTSPGHNSHVTVYDTLFENRRDDESLENIPKEALKLPQYRLMKKRKAQILQWNKEYADIRRLLIRQSHSGNGDIIDVTSFPTSNGSRTILAWMEDVRFYVSSDNEYTCPEVTMGKGYLNGRLHFALINTAKKKLINTLWIAECGSMERDDTIFYNEACEFTDYPFSIANPEVRVEVAGLIYYAKGGTDTTDGEADILHLVDFNRDGKKYEFGLFCQACCVNKASTLIGYKEKDDSLEWYKWEIKWIEPTSTGKDTSYYTLTHWIDEAVALELDKNKELNFSLDYRGRGGSMMRYYLNYDSRNDKYSGIVDIRERPEDSARKVTWLPKPEELKKQHPD